MTGLAATLEAVAAAAVLRQLFGRGLSLTRIREVLGLVRISTTG